MAQAPKVAGAANAKNGEWYGGQQYWNGTWSDPGQINSQSNQQGAGKKVSSAVNEQSSVAQGKAPTAIDTYLSKGATLPGNTNQVSTNAGASGTPTAQSVLDNFSSGANSALKNITLDSSKSDEQILAEVRSSMEPTSSQPTPPNLTATYQGFMASMGVNDLNTQLAGLNSQIASVQGTLEQRQQQEESKGGTVALGVIAGRQSEEARQAQVQLDSLNLQKGVLVDQINTQMTNINMLMQLTQQDYQNASQAWQSEFDVNSKIYDAFTSQVNARNTLAMEAEKQQFTESQAKIDTKLEVQKAAATNLQTFTNLLTSGNITYDQLPQETKMQITSMETQAGLPVGTISQIQMSAKDKLLNVSNYRGQVTAITMSPDGKINTQTFGQVNNSLTPYEQYNIQNKQNVSDANNQAIQDAQSGASLDQLTQIYGGTLTPTEINTIFNDYGTGQ